jgi:hypothetical protein
MKPDPSPLRLHPIGDADLDLAEAVRLLAGIAATGEPLRVVIDFRGRRIEMTAGVAEDRVAAPKLNTMEENILEALAEGTMSAEELSRAAGYQNDPAFRTCLASMRRRGLLTGAKGEAGYSVATD